MERIVLLAFEKDVPQSKLDDAAEVGFCGGGHGEAKGLMTERDVGLRFICFTTRAITHITRKCTCVIIGDGCD